MARALSRLCLKASTVEMSGTGAPCLIETPMPTRANGLALLSTSLVPSSGLMAPGGITTTSKYSPAATRRASAPAVSFSIVTLWPVFFSNSGTSSCATDLKAPAVRSLRSAATPGDAPAITRRAIRKARIVFSQAGLPHDVLVPMPEEAAEGGGVAGRAGHPARIVAARHDHRIVRSRAHDQALAGQHRRLDHQHVWPSCSRRPIGGEDALMRADIRAQGEEIVAPGTRQEGIRRHGRQQGEAGEDEKPLGG